MSERGRKNSTSIEQIEAEQSSLNCCVIVVFREVKSLVQQVMYSYGSNRKAIMPWKIHLTSVSQKS